MDYLQSPGLQVTHNGRWRGRNSEVGRSQADLYEVFIVIAGSEQRSSARWRIVKAVL